MKKLQNKDSKKQYQNVKGITLIALVVTIVVLLILAGVTIVTLFGENGIISKAQKAKQETENGVRSELSGLSDLEGILTGWTSGKNKKGETIFSKDNITLRIGDYINYNCASGAGADKSYTSYAYGKENNDHNGRTSGYTQDKTFKAKDYTGKWRVLGINRKGELEIIADTEAGYYELGTDNGTEYAEQGKVAYQYGVEELNAISRIYGYGDNATGARSINIDDINKITGYNPDNPANGKIEKFGKGHEYEYGAEVTYKWQGGTAPSYFVSNGVKGKFNDDYTKIGFTWYDKETKKWKNSPYTEKASDEPITILKNTFYAYYANTFTASQNGEALGLEVTSPEYDTIFGNEADYLLGTTDVGIDSWYNAIFGLYQVCKDYVWPQPLFSSIRGGFRTGGGVRPVVSLKSNIKLEKGSTDSNGYTTWNIK